MPGSPYEQRLARFAADPDDRAAFEFLEEHLFMRSDWAGLRDLYRRRRAAPSLAARARAELAMRLGQVCEERLSDDEGAIEAYTATVRIDPTLRRALRNLRRIYTRRGRFEVVLQIGEQEAALAAPGEERARILTEMGDVWRRELGDAAVAQEHYERARIERGGAAPDEPDADPAPFDEPDADPAPFDEPVPLTMPELDGGLPIDDDRAARVVGVLQRKLAARADAGVGDERAVALRLRIGELRAGPLGDPAGAIAVLEPALADDRALLEVAPALAGLYEQLGRLEPLIDVAERAGELCASRDERTFWNRRAAEAARAVGAPQRAIDGYRRLLADLPEDNGARTALCDLYRSRGEAEPLVRLLRDELARADEARELEIQIELASTLADQLADAAGAVPHLRRCVELEPRRSDLLEWAIGACGERGPLSQLDLIEHAIAHADSDAARAALLARRGALLADALAWNEEAAESWRAALALDPRQPLAHERLSAIAAQA